MFKKILSATNVTRDAVITMMPCAKLCCLPSSSPPPYHIQVLLYQKRTFIHQLSSHSQCNLYFSRLNKIRIYRSSSWSNNHPISISLASTALECFTSTLHIGCEKSQDVYLLREKPFYLCRHWCGKSHWGTSLKLTATFIQIVVIKTLQRMPQFLRYFHCVCNL